MAPVYTGRIVYNEIPIGYPIPGKTIAYDATQTIDLENGSLYGGILLKILVVSIDPFMRHRMQKEDPLASPVSLSLDFNPAICVVLRSEHPEFKPGDHVHGFLPFEQYTVVTNPALVGAQVIENKEKLPWSVYVGVCGYPGATAHHAWKEYAQGNSKKGDVVFITAAAVVVQLAKADGLKVIASAGSDNKVEYLRLIGADVAFNYKTTSTQEVLAKEGPITIYWDNVGGQSLDAALQHAAQKAHFIICGMISNYNDAQEPYNVRNLQNLVWREITFHGFTVSSLIPKYGEEFHRTFPARVASGEIKYKEHRVYGIEKGGEALLEMLQGKNFGKVVVVVAEE
ncbi:NAD(P)-binding protein [Fomes fomentarius]|nr:NAD(P)-binding protein [Fomes fomentarius]